MIQFKDMRPLNATDTIGTAIEAGSQKHNLAKPAFQRGIERIVNVPRSTIHASYQTGCVRLQQRDYRVTQRPMQK
jgi:hypothetical protein